MTQWHNAPPCISFPPSLLFLSISFTSHHLHSLHECAGQLWLKRVYQPIVGKCAVIALFLTLVVCFALSGKVIIDHPDKLLLVSAPLLLGFVIVVGANIVVTKV